jgi:hypothetical protein
LMLMRPKNQPATESWFCISLLELRETYPSILIYTKFSKLYPALSLYPLWSLKYFTSSNFLSNFRIVLPFVI